MALKLAVNPPGKAAVSELDCRSVFTVTFPANPPFTASVSAFNRGAVVAVALISDPPFAVAVRTHNCGSVFAVTLTSDPPFTPAVSVLDRGAVVAMELPLTIPETGTVRAFDRGAVVAMQLALTVPDQAAVGAHDRGAIVAMEDLGLRIVVQKVADDRPFLLVLPVERAGGERLRVLAFAFMQLRTRQAATSPEQLVKPLPADGGDLPSGLSCGSSHTPSLPGFKGKAKDLHHRTLLTGRRESWGRRAAEGARFAGATVRAGGSPGSCVP